MKRMQFISQSAASPGAPQKAPKASGLAREVGVDGLVSDLRAMRSNALAVLEDAAFRGVGAAGRHRRHEYCLGRPPRSPLAGPRMALIPVWSIVPDSCFDLGGH